MMGAEFGDKPGGRSVAEATVMSESREECRATAAAAESPFPSQHILKAGKPQHQRRNAGDSNAHLTTHLVTKVDPGGLHEADAAVSSVRYRRINSDSHRGANVRRRSGGSARLTVHQLRWQTVAKHGVSVAMAERLGGTVDRAWQRQLDGIDDGSGGR
jgi:hypothetical protein